MQIHAYMQNMCGWITFINRTSLYAYISAFDSHMNKKDKCGLR